MEPSDALARIEALRRPHVSCEDGWYSCPKSPDGCLSHEVDKDRCTCGADEHNARLDAVIAEIKSALETAAAVERLNAWVDNGAETRLAKIKLLCCTPWIVEVARLPEGCDDRRFISSDDSLAAAIDAAIGRVK